MKRYVPPPPKDNEPLATPAHGTRPIQPFSRPKGAQSSAPILPQCPPVSMRMLDRFGPKAAVRLARRLRHMRPTSLWKQSNPDLHDREVPASPATAA